MRPPVLIFADDSESAERLSRALISQFDCAPCVAEHLDAARESYHQLCDPTVFLDLRSDSLTGQFREFLDHLASLARPVRLVPISDGYVPCELAEPVDLFSVGHLKPPFSEGALAHLQGILAEGASEVASRKPPIRKSIRENGMEFSTRAAAMFPLVEQLGRVAEHDMTLLLVGETGTGKTTLARLIHEMSPRCEAPFQNVACGTLPPELIESEFFGHVRGAFTGADRTKIGRFEAAGEGTLLLDEIDVLAPKEQTKLLRVIETGEFEPVGSTETRQAHARLIVASNVDLHSLVEQEKFRSDLYYRLNVLEFRLLSLRERRLDIVPLAMQFVREYAEHYDIPVRRIHRDVLRRLKQYSWPGNIRELKNHVQRAVLFSKDGRLAPDHLAPVVNDPGDPVSNNGDHDRPQTLADRVASSERQILQEALRQHNFNRTATAKALGITRVGLYKKMRKLGMLETNGEKRTTSHETAS